MDIEGAADPEWRASVDGSSPAIARTALFGGLAAALVFVVVRYSGVFRLIAHDPGMWELAAAVAVGAGASKVRRLPALPRQAAWAVLLAVPASAGSRVDGLWLIGTAILALPALRWPRPILADGAALALLAGPAVIWSLSSTGPTFAPALLAVGAAMSLRAGGRDPGSAARASTGLQAACLGALLSGASTVLRAG